MPPKEKQGAKQDIKININLGEKKKPRKPRGRRKPKAKTLTTPTGSFAGSGQYRNPAISRQDIPQAQFLPVYVNQYPSSLLPQNAGYMNSGIPNNPQRLLTYGSPTTALGRMNTPANYQRQRGRRTGPSGAQQFYRDAETGQFYPVDDSRAMIQQQHSEDDLYYPYISYDDDAESVVSDLSSLSGPASTMTPSTQYSSDFSTLSTGERQRTMINEIGQNRLQPNPNIPRWDEEWNEDDDDGFFSSNSEPPALEEINFA